MSMIRRRKRARRGEEEKFTFLNTCLFIFSTFFVKDFFLFLKTLTVLGSTGQIYYRMYSFFSRLDCGLNHREEDHRQNIILITSKQGYMLSTRLITVDVNLDHWAKVV